MPVIAEHDSAGFVVSPSDSRTTKLLTLLAGLAAVTYILEYLGLASLRIGHPYDLEWQEGGAVDHVARILAGEKLYVEPSVDFVPFIYTPLYFYVSAALAKLLGLGYLPLRIVSLLASVGSMIVIFVMVRRETGVTFWGLLAAGLFAGTYRLGGAWLDIGRADSLYLLLLLLSVYTLRFHPSRLGLVAAGTWMSLSFLTKQSALVAMVPLALYALRVQRVRALWFVATFVGIVGLSTLILDRLHDGWYVYYVFDLPASHPWVLGVWLTFWSTDVLLLFGFSQT